MLHLIARLPDSDVFACIITNRSKALLLMYIESPTVLEIFQHQHYIDSLLDFLREKVFPHEQQYARCYYLNVRAFDAWTNTPHEGTNRGIKYCENNVRPNMSQAESTSTLWKQDDARTRSKGRSISDSFYKTQLHSDAIATQFLQKEADCQLQNQMKEAECYASMRIDETTWWILRCAPRKRAVGPKPVFERVRVVTVNEQGHMECTCGYPNQYGIPDRHMAHVALFYGVNYEEFSHHDVDIRHHNSYCRLVATKDPSLMGPSELNIRSQLLRARNLELPVPGKYEFVSFGDGPEFAIGSMCDGISESEQVRERLQEIEGQPAATLNYSASQISSAVNRMLGNATGFSQTEHNCYSSNNDNDSFGFPAFEDDDDDDDNKGVAPSTDSDLHSLMRDLQKTIDASSPNSKKYCAEALTKITNEMNARRKLRLGNEGTTGRVVSAKLRVINATSKHKKQV